MALTFRRETTFLFMCIRTCRVYLMYLFVFALCVLVCLFVFAISVDLFVL